MRHMHRSIVATVSACLVGVLIGLIAGCGVLTVDVDVYKGPLSNTEHVQTEQVIAMAVAAKPLLIELRNRLEFTQFYPANSKPVQDAHGKITESILNYKDDYMPDPGSGRVPQHEPRTGDHKETSGAPERWFRNDQAIRVNAVLGLYEDTAPPEILDLVAPMKRAIDEYESIASDEFWQTDATALLVLVGTVQKLTQRAVQKLSQSGSQTADQIDKVIALAPKGLGPTQLRIIAGPNPPSTIDKRVLESERMATDLRIIWDSLATLLTAPPPELDSLSNGELLLAKAQNAMAGDVDPIALSVLLFADDPVTPLTVRRFRDAVLSSTRLYLPTTRPDGDNELKKTQRDFLDHLDRAVLSRLAQLGPEGAQELLDADYYMRTVSTLSLNVENAAFLFDETDKNLLRWYANSSEARSKYGIVTVRRTGQPTSGPNARLAGLADYIDNIRQASSGGLERGRLPSGLLTLIERYRTVHASSQSDAAGQASNEPSIENASETARDALLEEMVHFGEKLVFLANNQQLLPSDPSLGDSSLTYARLLQTVGNSILVEIDELRRARQHNRRLEAKWAREVRAIAGTLPRTSHDVIDSVANALHREGDAAKASRDAAIARTKQARDAATGETKQADTLQPQIDVLNAKLDAEDKLVGGLQDAVSDALATWAKARTAAANAATDVKVLTDYAAMQKDAADAIDKLKDAMKAADDAQAVADRDLNNDIAQKAAVDAQKRASDALAAAAKAAKILADSRPTSDPKQVAAGRPALHLDAAQASQWTAFDGIDDKAVAAIQAASDAAANLTKARDARDGDRDYRGKRKTLKTKQKTAADAKKAADAAKADSDADPNNADKKKLADQKKKDLDDANKAVTDAQTPLDGDPKAKDVAAKKQPVQDNVGGAATARATSADSLSAFAVAATQNSESLATASKTAQAAADAANQKLIAERAVQSELASTTGKQKADLAAKQDQLRAKAKADTTRADTLDKTQAAQQTLMSDVYQAAIDVTKYKDRVPLSGPPVDSSKIIDQMVTTLSAEAEAARNGGHPDAQKETTVKVLSIRQFDSLGIDAVTSTAHDPTAVMDQVVAKLEAQYRTEVQSSGKDSPTAIHLQQAIEAAYDYRARMVYIRPASIFIKNSYPATSLQGGTEVAWQNLLAQQALRSTPLLGESLVNLHSDSKTIQQIDRQFWQNINRIRVAGSGINNYVIAKDDIGNWYVKSYVGDPTPIIKAAQTAALYGASAKLGQDVVQRAKDLAAGNTGGGTPPETIVDKQVNVLVKNYDTATTTTAADVRKSATGLKAAVQNAWAADSNLTSRADALKSALASVSDITPAVSDNADAAKDPDLGNKIIATLQAMKDMNGAIDSAIDAKNFGNDNEEDVKNLKQASKTAADAAAAAKKKVPDDLAKETTAKVTYDKAVADASQAESDLTNAEAGNVNLDAPDIVAKRNALNAANQKRSTAEADYQAAYKQRTTDETAASQAQDDADKATKAYADAKAAGVKAASMAKADCARVIRTSVSKFVDQRLTSVGGYASALDVIAASVAPTPKPASGVGISGSDTPVSPQ